MGCRQFGGYSFETQGLGKISQPREPSTDSEGLEAVGRNTLHFGIVNPSPASLPYDVTPLLSSLILQVFPRETSNSSQRGLPGAIWTSPSSHPWEWTCVQPRARWLK